MRILFDYSTPGSTASCADISHRFRSGPTWRDKLGALLDAAQAAVYDILVTADKNMRHQQNLTGRKIAIVVPGNAQWPILRGHVDKEVVALDEAVSLRGYNLILPRRHPVANP